MSQTVFSVQPKTVNRGNSLKRSQKIKRENFKLKRVASSEGLSIQLVRLASSISNAYDTHGETWTNVGGWTLTALTIFNYRSLKVKDRFFLEGRNRGIPRTVERRNIRNTTHNKACNEQHEAVVTPPTAMATSSDKHRPKWTFLDYFLKPIHIWWLKCPNKRQEILYHCTRSQSKHGSVCCHVTATSSYDWLNFTALRDKTSLRKMYGDKEGFQTISLFTYIKIRVKPQNGDAGWLSLLSFQEKGIAYLSKNASNT